MSTHLRLFGLLLAGVLVHCGGPEYYEPPQLPPPPPPAPPVEPAPAPEPYTQSAPSTPPPSDAQQPAPPPPPQGDSTTNGSLSAPSMQAPPPPPVSSSASAPLVYTYPTGQWVWLSGQGWVWIPEGAETVEYDRVPYAYLYTPSVGWTWYVSPWGWGRYHYGVWVRHPWHPVGWHGHWVAHPNVVIRLGPRHFRR